MKDQSDFSDIKAVFINCSLKNSKSESHTQLLIDKVANIMRSQKIEIEHVYPLDKKIAFGMIKDGKDSGLEDDWPEVQKKILDADILVIGTPIWLGQKSSVATQVIERMYAFSGDKNSKDQYAYYGKTGGCIVTGNEDGVKHCAMDILYALQHIGYTIPPQADCGWIGEAGPGPSYGDKLENSDVRAGFDNDFTNRNATFMAWNLMHMAKMLKSNNGIDAIGNTTDGWEDVANAKHENPEYH